MDNPELPAPKNGTPSHRKYVLRLKVGPPAHASERLTREDVQHLIEAHGGSRGLDLRRADLRRADLSNLDLYGADLEQSVIQKGDLFGIRLQEADLSQADLRGVWLLGADLREARLQGTDLRQANLGESDLQGAFLRGANLQSAALLGANLQGADLANATLSRAYLRGANLRDANLEGARWADYKVGEEIAGDLAPAASVYRTLKQRHTEAGIYDVAGEFHYREMEARRKLAWRGELDAEYPRRRPYAISLYALRLLYGYGERPERVIAWAAGIVFGLAAVHWAFGTVTGGFWGALYFSAVSFTALGYGAWAPDPQGWAGKFLGVGEALMGVFMMALFLVTFTRKMTR